MSEGVALSTLLDRVSGTLTRLHERALDLQFATGELVEGGGGENASTAVTALQDLDLMTQELDGLAGYMSGLSGQCEAGWQVDPAPMVQALTLASLAARLSSDGTRAEEAQAPEDDIDLFDMTGTG